MTHRGIFLTILLGVMCTGLLFAGEGSDLTVDAVNSTHSIGIPSGVPSPVTAPSPISTEDVLYDNGPLITHPGGGFGGADASAVQTALLMSVYGFGQQGSLGTFVADEFVVTDDSWTLDSLCFFGYQTGSSTTSTFTAVKYQIWDGDPSIGGSTIVCSDSVTLAGGLTTSWSGIYRTLDTDVATASTRPIMYNAVPVNCVLPAGTYWVAWQSWGSLTSGPWQPPVTILGTTNTGNAQQFTGGTWVDLTDAGSGAPQGLPFIVKGSVPGDPDLFWDDFESYTAGTQLVSQNNVDWDTWSNTPGSGEDPFVSSNYAYSGSNSVVIAQNNDLIRRHGDRTTGTWGMSWQMYIPAGKAGYFNTMSDFDVSTYWAMECYFDAGGTGRLLTGNPDVNFTWTEDAWQLIEVVVDLDADSAQLLIDGTIISGWKWTLGASGGTGPLQLAVNDFFGASALDEMYFDDYHFAADMIRSDIGPEAQMSLTHTPGNLNMGIFNDGSIGTENVGFIGPGITWNGVQGCFVGGPMFGTSDVGSVNGLIGSFTVFGDLVNVASDFAGGFTSDANFDQIAWANLDDSGAAVPYGVDILQRSYSNTGEEVGFIRYGYVNSSGDNLSSAYAGIFVDWDVNNFATNSGGVDTERNLIYTFGTTSGDPYFGLVALDGNLGGRTTTATPPGSAPEGSFDWISTLSTVVDPNGDYRTWIGTGPFDILAGDTVWVTFAVVAGDDLAGIRANADGAVAKATAVGWILPTGVDGGVAEIPAEFNLAQNYPNPFNPTTTIQYSLKEQANVVLKVYDILGKEVRTLINEEQGAGVRQVVWDGKNNTGAQVASGMYVYRIQANDFVSTMKMLFMK